MSKEEISMNINMNGIQEDMNYRALFGIGFSL